MGWAWYSRACGSSRTRCSAGTVATTYGEGSFDETGEYRFGNASQLVFNAIVAYLVPELAAPVAG